MRDLEPLFTREEVEAMFAKVLTTPWGRTVDAAALGQIVNTYKSMGIRTGGIQVDAVGWDFVKKLNKRFEIRCDEETTYNKLLTLGTSLLELQKIRY